MAFLLDTNVVSELRRARTGKADANVVAWTRAQTPGLLFVSVITVLELELGVRQVERRDPDHGRGLGVWLENQVLPTFAERILPVDTAVARRAAAFHVPDPAPERDTLIAATALVHALTVVTRNTSDFERTDVDLIDPWLMD